MKRGMWGEIRKRGEKKRNIKTGEEKGKGDGRSHKEVERNHVRIDW